MLYLGSDHGGFALKEKLCEFLGKHGIAYEDLGTYTTESCDYPRFAALVATAVQKDSTHRGILICTSGVGMEITANKFHGIYAARLTQPGEVKTARQHNGINVLCLPGNLSVDLAGEMVTLFLETPLDISERHQRRRQLIAEFEGMQSR
ncbi:MAG: RpiB/LacA/LacB family sugar-phosphate isomerase [bacterium]